MRTKKLIDSIISTSKDPIFVSFVQSFYTYIPDDYLDRYSEKEFAEFAKLNFEFAKSYQNSRLVQFDYLESNNERTFFQIIGDNKPFIVDSIKSLLSEYKVAYEFFLHPVVRIERDSKNNISNFTNINADVSIVFIAIEGNVPEKLSEEITKTIQEKLKQVDLTYASWSETLRYLSESEKIIESQAEIFAPNDINDAKNFLEWLKNDNFTFFGAVDFEITKKTTKTLSGDPSIGGDLNLDELLNKERPDLSENIIEFGKLKKTSVTLVNSFIDYVLIKQFDKNSELVFCRLFLGLYGSNLDYQSVKDIPIIREKLSYVLERSNFVPKGYNEKKIRVIVESLPRAALFHVNKVELYDMCIQTLSSMSVGNVKVFKLGECKQNFIELIVFLPRGRFTPETHLKIQAYIQEKFGIKIIKDYMHEVNQNFVFIYSTFYSESCSTLSNFSVSEMEKDLERLTCKWEDEFVKACKKEYDIKKALYLVQKYENSFPNDYQYNHSPSEASIDVSRLELLNESNNVVFDFIQNGNETSLKIFSSSGKLTLSSTMPILENLGFLVSEESRTKF